MSSEGVLSVVIAGAVLGVGGWRYMHQPPLAHVGIGVDPSVSVERNCAGVAGAARGLFARAGVRGGSTVSLLAMGASPADPAPDLRFRAPIPIEGDSVYGRSEEERAYRDKLKAVLGGIETSCAEIADTQHTPLYALVEQGLIHLRSEEPGCGPDGDCFFLIKSDLLEDVHPDLSALFTRAAKNPQEPVPIELAASLDNRGIDIVFCGTTESRPSGKTPAARAALETRKRIWNELFAAPERVSFQPFCVASSPE